MISANEVDAALNPENKVSHDELLSALERIELLVGDDFAEEMSIELALGRLSGNERQMASRLGDIYRLAHGWNPKHACFHVHTNWRAVKAAPPAPPTDPGV